VIRSGANVNGLISGISVLHTSVEAGKQYVVELLLNNNVDIGLLCNGETALDVAVSKGFTSIIKLLRDASNKPEIPERDISNSEKADNMALHLAIFQNDERKVSQLLRPMNAVDVERLDTQGKTGLV